MPDIKISAIARKTGFSPRYWQKHIHEIPSAKYVQIGQRRVFLVDEAVFDEYWDKKRVAIPCQKTSAKEIKRGFTVSSTEENVTRVPYEPMTLQSLKSVLKEYSNS